MLVDHRICSDCVRDEYLKRLIADSPNNAEPCTYCAVVAPTIKLDKLASLIDDVVATFYEVSSQSMAVIHFDYSPEGEPLADILDRFISEGAIQDLSNLLEELWFDHSSCERRYGDDPWFVEITSVSWELSADWSYMEHSLRREARYLNPVATETLERVFGPLLQDRTIEGEPVIVEAGPNRYFDKFYRARVFQNPNTLDREMNHPERALGPPPSGLGSAGRMNAKGVSVFYGATSPDIAVAEVRPPVGSFVAVGAFKVIRPLRLLDLNRLRSIQLKRPFSPFDPVKVKQAMRCQFLNEMEHRLTAPVMPESADEGYILTLVIADFLATHPILELDGIIFHSTQVESSADVNHGTNVILFSTASKVLESDEGGAKHARFNLWENDDEGIWVRPQLWERLSNVIESASMMPRHADFGPQPALELDRTTLEIREVKGVEFHCEINKIEVHR